LEDGSSILGATFWLVIASLLNVGEYGLINYYIALASTFATLGTLGLNTTVTTYLAKGEEAILNETISLILLSSVILALTLSIFRWELGLLSAVMIFFGIALAEVLGRKMYAKYALLSMGQKLSQIALCISLYFCLGIPGIILGYFLSFLAFSYRYFKSIRNFSTKLNSLKERLNFMLHSYGFNLLNSFSTYLDKAIVGGVFGYYVLGLYQLGFQFFLFLSLIPTSLYNYLLPEESSGKSRKETELIGLTFSIISALTIFIISPIMIENFFPTFLEATQVVRVISLASIPSTILAILTAELLGEKRSREVFAAEVLHLIFLTTALIIMGGIIGALGFFRPLHRPTF